jgi:effector-binding domain-containing protein
MTEPLVDAAPSTVDDAQPIEIVEIRAQPTAALRIACTVAELPATLGQAFDEAVAAITAAGAEFAGPPYARYRSFDPTGLEAEVGFPVAGPFTASGRVERSELPGGRVARTTHIGSYEGIGGTWERVTAWLQEQGLEMREPGWESYLTDPGTDPDPATWRTELTFPIG